MNKLLTRIVTHHATMPRHEAHSRRAKGIYTAIFCIIVSMAIISSFNCSSARNYKPQNGCEQQYKKRATRKFVAWIKWTPKGKDTGQVTVMDMQGNPTCSFKESAK